MISRRFFASVFCFATVAIAADAPEDVAEKAYLTNLNAVVVFTSKEGLNSGYYEFTKVNTSMAVIHVADRYQFGPFAPKWNVFLVGSAGYSETWMTVGHAIPRYDGNMTLTGSNLLQTYTGGLGAGVRYRDGSGLETMAGLELIYSRVRFKNRSDKQGGDWIGDFFEGHYTDNLTYHFLTAIEYNTEIDGFMPYARLRYDLYETKSAFSLEQLSTFTSQSGVTSLALGCETAPLFYSGQCYLTLEGYLWGSWLGGDLPKVVGFDGYGTGGATAYWYVPDRLEYIRRFFVDVSTIRADGLRGYNLGFGFSLAY